MSELARQGSPPWLEQRLASASFLENLSAEIGQFVHFAALQPAEVAARNALFYRVKQAIYRAFRHAVVYYYGSLPSGMSLYFSDVDIAVENVRLQMVQEALAGQAYVRYISAHVPILKCQDYLTSIEFDVSYGGARVVRDVYENRQANDDEKTLLLLVKHYLAYRELNKPFTGGMSGHILNQLVRAFLQARHSVYGTLNDERTRRARLFLQFFDFYGCRFNSAHVAIVSLQLVRRRAFCGETLCLISDYADIGAAVFNWVLIRRSFEAGLLALLRRENERGASILARIFSPSAAGLRIRQICQALATSAEPGADSVLAPATDSATDLTTEKQHYYAPLDQAKYDPAAREGTSIKE